MSIVIEQPSYLGPERRKETRVAPAVSWLNQVKWDEQGLIPVIAQDAQDNTVLMFAWMNREALQKTHELRRAVYWSRSRKKLWFKGEESGHLQHVEEIRLDCDNDVIILRVNQVGGVACHTGRRHCFFQRLEAQEDATPVWVTVDPVLKNPDEIYRS
ncbi:phosphoribosyl-AMP cyclohydrolase [Parvibium lacunae]|uniref:Phosphoribosyl-AMP cyclohydrolase n=1 Tax=Parvibium lacunae TaxID=1888893 RepID=A0A368L520_9BURK|nr:phosphoribosyl-AMP cyclohydrolase [Parvibium lacunae]RCS58573.1 phosphoribosyl-AMP cyclohydrolase [Parvibium lacunae]